MGYCALADIRKLVPEQDLAELTDDSSPAVAVDADNVNRAITDAGELIDGYIRSRYQLPLSPVPALLNTLAADIAVYRLYARRMRLTPPECVSERYKGALDILKQIQRGLVNLDISALPQAQNYGPETSGDERVFTKTSLDDY